MRKASATVVLRGIRKDEEYILEAARALFPREGDVFVPVLPDGRSLSDIFTEAHNAIYRGVDFDRTRLHLIICELFETCRSFAAWWANDWSDLPMFSRRSEVFDEVARQLGEPVGEVYVRWETPR